MHSYVSIFHFYAFQPLLCRALVPVPDLSQADERALCVLPSSYSSAARTIKVEDARYCNRMSWCDAHHWYHDVPSEQPATTYEE